MDILCPAYCDITNCYPTFHRACLSYNFPAVRMTFRPSEYSYLHFLVSRVERGVRHVQINIPATCNAFAVQDWRDYAEIMTRLDADPHTLVIILSLAVSKAFSSGLNLRDALQSMLHLARNPMRQQLLKEHITEFQKCIEVPAQIATPTICLMNGINYGLALDISACCSIRVATADATFSIREIKLGIPADIGLLQRLAHVTNNSSLLFQHALRGDTFNARHALHMGFVSKIVPSLKAGLLYCVAVADDIASNEQWAIRGTKRSIQDMLEGARSVKQGLEDIAEYNSNNIDERFLRAMAQTKL